MYNIKMTNRGGALPPTDFNYSYADKAEAMDAWDEKCDSLFGGDSLVLTCKGVMQSEYHPVKR